MPWDTSQQWDTSPPSVWTSSSGLINATRRERNLHRSCLLLQSPVNISVRPLQQPAARILWTFQGAVGCFPHEKKRNFDWINGTRSRGPSQGLDRENRALCFSGIQSWAPRLHAGHTGLDWRKASPPPSTGEEVTERRRTASSLPGSSVNRWSRPAEREIKPAVSLLYPLSFLIKEIWIIPDTV